MISLSKINKEQQKILVMLIIAGAITISVIVGFYTPTKRQLVSIQKEFEGVQKEVSYVLKELYVDKDLQKRINDFDEKQTTYKNLFLLSEEEIVKKFSNEANRRRLKWISFEPKSSEDFLDDKGMPVIVDGYKCKKNHMFFEVSGAYEDVGNYLKYIEKMEAMVNTVDNLSIVKTEPGTTNVRMKCTVTVYRFKELQEDKVAKNG